MDIFGPYKKYSFGLIGLNGFSGMNDMSVLVKDNFNS